MAQLNIRAPELTGAVGFGVRAGRIAVVGGWVLLVIGAFLRERLQLEAWILIPLSAGLVGALLATTRGAHRLRPGTSVAVVVCAIAAATIVFAMRIEDAPLWLYCTASYLLAALGARGNFRAAGIGAAIVWGMGVLWASYQGADAGAYASLLTVPVLTVVVLIVWNRAIERIGLRGMRYRSETEQAVLDQAAAERRMAKSRHELIKIRREAGDLLSRLAAGETVTARFRQDLTIAEASIRDRIRSSWLLHPVLEAAVLDVRIRGGTVHLIGDTPHAELTSIDFRHDHREVPSSVPQAGSEEDPRSGTISEGLAHAIADRIRPYGEGAILTIRSLPPSRSAVVTLLIVTDTGTEAVRYSWDGSEHARP